MPPRNLLDTDPECHWAELRRQWLLTADRINLDSGALGCQPLPVLLAMIDHLSMPSLPRDVRRDRR